MDKYKLDITKIKGQGKMSNKGARYNNQFKAAAIILVRVPYNIGKAIKLAFKNKMLDLGEHIRELKTSEYRGKLI